MNKTIISIIFLNTLSSNIYSQNDTVFLKNDSLNKIFIIQSKDTKYHNSLSDFKKFPNYIEAYKNNHIINSRWIPLYKFENEYYLYEACDIGEHRILISEENLTIEGWEFYSYKICGDIIKYSRKHYGLKYKGFDNEEQSLEINIIDKEAGIAVFKFTSKGHLHYQLMVEADKVNNYYVIVNYCEFSKVEEYPFEKIDFEGLLKYGNTTKQTKIE